MRSISENESTYFLQSLTTSNDSKQLLLVTFQIIQVQFCQFLRDCFDIVMLFYFGINISGRLQIGVTFLRLVLQPQWGTVGGSSTVADLPRPACVQTATCWRTVLTDSYQAILQRASALVPFPVSACRLLALSEGQLSAIRPAPPLQATIKGPLFWPGEEK